MKSKWRSGLSAPFPIVGLAIARRASVTARISGGNINPAGDLGAHGLGAGVTAGGGLLAETALIFALVFGIFATAIDSRGTSQCAPRNL